MLLKKIKIIFLPIDFFFVPRAGNTSNLESNFSHFKPDQVLPLKLSVWDKYF
jgi:hypothetical protein